MLNNQKGMQWRPTWKWLIGVGSAIIALSIAGIIGNRADAGFVWAWDFLTKPQKVDDVRPLAFIFTIIFLSYVAWALFRQERLTKQNVLVEKQKQSAEGNYRKRAEQQKSLETKAEKATSENKQLTEANQVLTLQARALRSENVSLKRNYADMEREKQALTQQVAVLTKERGDLQGALLRMNHLANLDQSLLICIASVITNKSENREQAMKLLLKKFLKDATDVFTPDVCRASILRPDKSGEYLECWEHHCMPDISLRLERFYIGDRRNIKRGVAGHSFTTRDVEIVHLRRVNGRWKADHDQYTPSKNNVTPPTYRSFISAPIISPDNQCLGVLCLDSDRETTFDSDEVVKFADDLAARLGAAITIYNHLIATS
ncbi:MAG TPA: GAF domain-containing protein [Chloroflexia bacterium]|jgi:hypothetical protein